MIAKTLLVLTFWLLNLRPWAPLGDLSPRPHSKCTPTIWARCIPRSPCSHFSSFWNRECCKM